MAKIKAYDIPAAAKKLNYTEQYIRTLIRRGVLETKMIPIAEGAQVTKHIITEATLDKFVSTRTRKTRRTDGRTKWIAYATFDEMELILELLEDNDFGTVADEIRPANQIKTIPDWMKGRNDRV